MLREIIDTLSPAITELVWVEVYGGLATTFELPFDGVTKKLPVRCGLSYGACMENGKYAELIPDSKKKSLLFWEDKGDIDIDYQGKRMAMVEGQARLMVWLNLQELGHTDQCTVSAQAEAEIMSIIRSRKEITSGGLSGSAFDFVPAGIPVRNPDLWAGYDFDEKIGYLMHPFDYFSLDVNFTGAICFAPLVIGTETDCLY